MKTIQSAALPGLVGSMDAHLVRVYLEKRSEILLRNFKDRSGKLKGEANEICLADIRNLHRYCLVWPVAPPFPYGSINNFACEYVMWFARH